jgi:hypothetical protein
VVSATLVSVVARPRVVAEGIHAFPFEFDVSVVQRSENFCDHLVVILESAKSCGAYDDSVKSEHDTHQVFQVRQVTSGSLVCNCLHVYFGVRIALYNTMVYLENLVLG